MIEILTKLEYRDYAPGLWELTAPLIFRWRGRTFVIPAGFICDFFSIPRVFRWWRANNRGEGNEPAVIHDFLLRFRDMFGLSVMDCHRAFRDFMDLLGFGATGRVKYVAVVVGGWVSPGKGDGTPPRRIRSEMRKRGHCWERYVQDVWRANEEALK